MHNNETTCQDGGSRNRAIEAWTGEAVKKTWLLVLVCASLFLLAVTCVLASSLSASGDANDVPTMTPDEVEVGMKGKAKTVFSGSRIEEFDIEILGVLKSWRPGGDLILARASGHEVERTGIAAGMSGSPVYIDGKLIGAMAYAWSFSKEPITGITPINEMLEERQDGLEGTSEWRRSFGWGDAGSSGGALQEIETPLLLSGFHPVVQYMIEKELSVYNITVAQSGGGVEAGEAELLPGAPLAAQFVTGDATASAMGTVTYVQKGKILGFGHGLFHAGTVEIPMSSAYIHAVVPSLSASMKLGSASEIVGTIVYDRAAGVVGELGTVPVLIPVSVAVECGSADIKKFDFEIMRHSLLTPSLVGWSVSSAALTAGGSTGDLTVAVEWDVELDVTGGGTRSLNYRDVFFSVSPALEIAQSVSEPLRLLMLNQFEEVSPRSVTCKLSVERGRRVAQVDEIHVTPRALEAGDSFEVSVRLKPFRGETRLERFKLRIPETCRSELLNVLVCSGPEMRAWEGEATSRRLPPKDFDQLVSQIAGSGKGNRLECVVYVEEPEAGIEGESFPSPPESFSSVVGASGRAGAVARTRVAVLDSASVDTEFVIEGRHTMSLKLVPEKGRR